MTIIVHQRPLGETRTPSKSCRWLGEAVVNGCVYTATSRMSPANEIARQLATEGMPDAPMRIYTAGLKGCLTWRSFYRAARYTLKESAQTPLTRAPWTDMAALRAEISCTIHSKQGVNGSAGTPIAGETPAPLKRAFRHAA
jgi:hypothetical protein